MRRFIASEPAIEIERFKALIDQAIREDKAIRPDFDQYARAASIGVVGLGVLNETLPCPEAAAGSPPSAPDR